MRERNTVDRLRFENAVDVMTGGSSDKRRQYVQLCTDLVYRGTPILLKTYVGVLARRGNRFSMHWKDGTTDEFGARSYAEAAAKVASVVDRQEAAGNLMSQTTRKWTPKEEVEWNG